MERKVYMEKLFSNRREKLIKMCLELQKKGKGFIYIMPSSTAIFQVRDRFAEENGGFLNSKVIVFDDLELDIVKDKISMDSVIYDPMDRVIIADVCKRLRNCFRYYGNIYSKKGFHQEIAAFIRTLKRSCIDEGKLSSIEGKINDEVLKDKLHDLIMIYREYDRTLRENGIYDRNDISKSAVELVNDYKGFDKIEAIIIDGFTDIEPVSMKLVEAISKIDKVNIYVNCPYRNKFSEDFLNEEIAKPFGKMGFEVIYDDGTQYEVLPTFKELCDKFYSGENMERKLEGLSIQMYPCIEAEVRETARSIKERLMAGEDAEEIAVYVNNSDAYAEPMVRIFKEFGIPISITYELPSGSSELVRKIIKSFENRDEESLSAGEWLDILQQELDSKKEYIRGLIERALKGEIDFVDKLEIKAFDALGNLAKGIRASFEKSGMINYALNREYFTGYMLEGIAGIKIFMEKGNNRGVKIMSTAHAKGVYFKHVYVLGLNEGEIPAEIKNNGLFDSFEASILNKNGIRYRDFLWELSREKIRFNLALSSAKKSITLSYRGSDEDGKFAIASSFVDEIKFLSGLEENRAMTMRDRFEKDFNSAMSVNELERGYIKEYFEGKYRKEYSDNFVNSYKFIRNISKDMDEILTKGMVEYHREMEKDFNEYEGIMESGFERIAGLIASFSPSALNEYLKCPFKYMVKYLYKPGEDEEDEGEYSDREIGNFYHKVLYEYYRNEKKFEVFDEGLFDNVFTDAWNGLRTLHISDEESKRKRMDFYDRLKNFISLDIERLKNFEKHSKGNVLRPYILEGVMDESRTFGVNITCKVDRIDLEYSLKDGELVPTGRYVIYDYKKKSISGINDILENKDYQLPIYYYASTEQLKKELNLKNMECMALLYLSVEGTEDKLELDGIYMSEYKKALGLNNKRLDIKRENFLPLMEYLKGLILNTIGNIKSGKFNYKLMCGHIEGFSSYGCEYEGLCRYSQNKMRVLLEE